MIKTYLTKISLVIIGFSLLFLAFSPPASAAPPNTNCQPKQGTFFGLPHWNRGLPASADNRSSKCEVDGSINLSEEAKFDDSSKTKIIFFNILAIILTLAGYIAVAFVIVGGFKFVLSSGNSEQAASARRAVINALIGLVIVIMARVVVEILFNNVTGANSPTLSPPDIAASLNPVFANTEIQHIPKVSADANALNRILNLVFMILGSISLIVLAIQGAKYSLSSGDPQKTTEARNGIIYALVGLVVATSAWNIVNFALSKVIESDSVVSTNTVVNLLNNIGGLIVFVTGVISVIMIIVGGFRFMLGSSEDTIKKGRNTIIYALVGLVVGIMAGPLLNLALSQFA